MAGAPVPQPLQGEHLGVPTSAAPSAPTPANFDQLIQMMRQTPVSTQGLTQVGPGGSPQLPASQQTTPPQQQNVRAFGPGERGAAMRQDSANMAISAHNMAQNIAQKVEARKTRQIQQTVDQYTSMVKGINEAKSQVQQGQQLVQQAQQRLQANPQDAEAQQMAQRGQQMVQQGQAALQTNQTNLDDLANDPKKHKVITKAFGIDDKNSGTPERQAAIQSIKKQMGVGDQAANMISRQPQNQQMSPEGAAQAEAVKAGIVGKPSTGAQAVNAAAHAEQAGAATQNAETRAQDVAFKQEAAASKAGFDTDKFISSLPQKGLVAERDASGNVERNPDGTIKTRNMTAADLKDNPELAAKYAQVRANTNLKVAQAQATMVRAETGRMAENRKQKESLEVQKAIQDPNYLAQWGKNLSDPSTGATLANVPSKLRGPVLSYMAANGQTLSKSLTGDEFKRMDLAHNAVQNIEEAQSILKRRPDMFGPAGFGKTKFEMALAGGDPDAVKYQAAIKLANLPAVGIHGVRGKWAIEDLDKLDGNLYLNADAMTGVLGEIHRSASEFSKQGGRPTTDANNDPMGILK